MGPPVDTVHADPDMPAAVDIVIIGGGIIKTCAALSWSNGASRWCYAISRASNPGRNWGWVRKARRDLRAGMIDVTPDAVPVISPVDRLPGLIVAIGFSGHGFGIGPDAGRRVAGLATGAPPVVDPHAFRLSRYGDGSNPRPMSGI